MLIFINSTARCGKPNFPSDGVPVNAKKLTNYKQGDKITVKCKSSELLTNQMTCTKNGWTALTSACIGEFKLFIGTV